MDELILRVLADDATELEVRKVERWRQEAPGNEAVYQGHERVWRAMDALAGAPVPPPPALASITEKAERRRAGARRRAALRSPWLGYAVAAAACVALVFGLRGREGPGPQGLLSPVASSSGQGSVVTLDLSDGSVVRLAQGTDVDFPSVADRREVVLDGRAFFAVTQGEHPFVVRTGAGSVTVHGTRFEVTAQGGVLRLVVVEGTVRLEGPGGAVDVAAGEVAYLEGGGPPRVVEVQDVWSLLEWDEGLLVYQATPLSSVAQELASHFGTGFHVAPEVAGRRITAWFQDESLGEVVAAVCLVAAVRCEVGETVSMEATETR